MMCLGRNRESWKRYSNLLESTHWMLKPALSKKPAAHRANVWLKPPIPCVVAAWIKSGICMVCLGQNRLCWKTYSNLSKSTNWMLNPALSKKPAAHRANVWLKPPIPFGVAAWSKSDICMVCLGQNRRSWIRLLACVRTTKVRCLIPTRAKSLRHTMQMSDLNLPSQSQRVAMGYHRCCGTPIISCKSDVLLMLKSRIYHQMSDLNL